MKWEVKNLPSDINAAIAGGAKAYFTGEPCKHGHVAPRFTKGGSCKECHRLRSERHKAKCREVGIKLNYSHAVRPGYWEEYRKTGRAKLNARAAVNNKIVQGKLKRQPCEVCGATKRIHAHHDDYTKPLDIKWLCAMHHQARHKELRDQGIKL